MCGFVRAIGNHALLIACVHKGSSRVVDTCLVVSKSVLAFDLEAECTVIDDIYLISCILVVGGKKTNRDNAINGTNDNDNNNKNKHHK